MTGGRAAGPDDLAGLVLAGAAALLAVVWGGAQLAALAGTGQPLPAGVGEAAGALLALPSTPGDPAAAWPAHLAGRLPGPVLYWACTTAAAAAALAAAAAVLRLAAPRVGVGRRVRLGVDARARLARPADLAPLLVRRPTPGRLILGTVGGRLVATEDRRGAPARSRRARRRQGDRSAVLVVGPARCGKTANAITGILEWTGPAVLSSVRTDLLDATLARRRELGEVRVFDPTGATGVTTSRWSPLRGAATIEGAQRAARALADAAPKTGADNLGFFTALAEQLLWPLLWLAAVDDRTMAELVGWVLAADQPSGDDRGDVAALLDAYTQHPEQDLRDGATAARAGARAIWSLDERTRGAVYATCHTMLRAWQDPSVAAAADAQEIDLDWLLSGSNTLYLCGPAHEQQRLAPVFAGLLGDLFQQAYQTADRTGGPLPLTLVVLDEAGNTPAAWLPSVASTCAGIGILLVTIWQSKAQIDQAYGTLADSVVTNHGTKLLFSGISDRSTLEYAAALLGDEELQQRSLTADPSLLGGAPHTVTHAATTAKLVPNDVLRRIPPGRALLIHGTLLPAELTHRPYYRQRHLRGHRKRERSAVRPPAADR